MEVIGCGGMGIVLKGQDTRLHRVAAIKVLAPELASNATARRRFLREAQAAAAVSHDHVVTIYGIDETNGSPYLAMEYVAGQSLQQRIDKRGALEVKEILRIGRQIAQGLAAAHEQGLIHRDIKPANILLENSIERVKITDFGLARAVDDVGITKTGTVCLLLEPDEQPADPSAEPLLRSLVRWSGRRNVFRQDAIQSRLLSGGYTDSDLVETLEFTDAAAWQRFWGLDEADALVADIRFQGEDRFVKTWSEPGWLTPEDFRLLPGSAGHPTGPDGVELGANVDLVGPGEAYQRWKQSPEYQQWLNQARQRFERERGTEDEDAVRH